MRRLKSFIVSRRSSKSSAPASSPSHPEIRLGPAQLLDERRKQEQLSSSGQQRDQTPNVQLGVVSDHAHKKHTSRRPSASRPVDSYGDHPVGVKDHGPQSPEVSEEGNSIAEDYRAYLGAISPGDNPSPDVEFFSLGGDSRLRTGDSEMKHNEDIADRNIVQYGSKNSRQGSVSLAGSQVVQDHHARRKSVAAFIESLGSPEPPKSPDSVRGGSAASSPKYSLGSGIVTEGSLVDGILPHVEDPHAQPYNRKDWPTRLARDESYFSSSSRRTPRGSEHGSSPGTRSFGRMMIERTTPQKETPQKEIDSMELREAVMGGPGDDHKGGLRADLDGVVDLRDTEDADKETRWAPAVTHEVVKPQEHEILEERIYREIHNHEVYHYIQPVYETEILPARHWIYNQDNELVEVAADELPECTGAKQRWSIVPTERTKPSMHVVRSAPQVREPKIISDKTYMTPEGFERRETTILHPPELEDLSDYSGPVVPIELMHHPESAPERNLKAGKKLEHIPDGRRLTMEELSEVLPGVRTGSSSSLSRSYTGSLVSSPASKRLSIPRKPVPVLSC